MKPIGLIVRSSICHIRLKHSSSNNSIPKFGTKDSKMDHQPSAPYPDSNNNNNPKDQLLDRSIHSTHITEVHQMPMNIIQRPIVPVLDENKVQSLMQTFKDNPESIPPIDVMWIEGSQNNPDDGGASNNNNYYFSFGGCHRFEAAKKLGLPTIKAKLFKSTIDDLRFYLGSSTPDLK